MGVGLRHGPALLGNIGDKERLEFATIGDTVNIASRMETLTRSLGAPIAMSDTFVQAVRRESGSDAPELAALTQVGPQEVRGVAEPIDVWIGGERPA